MAGFRFFDNFGFKHFWKPETKLVCTIWVFPVLLQQTQVEVEGKTDEAVLDQFMCYCDNSDSML